MNIFLTIRRGVFMTLLVLTAFLHAPRSSAESLPIRNDAVWTDTGGNPIRAQGGSMMKQGDTFYWYGFDGEVPAPKSGRPMYRAVRCYTSKDLSRWTLAGDVLTVHAPNRVDVVYCPLTKDYVMFTKEMDDAGKLSDAGVGIATCATPTGEFVWRGRMQIPDSIGGGDQSVFIDDDGKAYLVYTTWVRNKESGKVAHNKDMMCVELAPDFRSVVRVVYKFPDTRIEAPSIFKRNGIYYWCASGIAWWYSSPTSWCMATKLEGPWTPWKIMKAKRDPSHPLAKQMLRDSYNSQHDFVLNVTGDGGSFQMYCGDRYSQFTTLGTGWVVWLPLQFAGDEPVMDWYQTWNVDAAKGTWSGELTP